MGFLWCPYCRNPHLLSETICPITHRPLQSSGGKKSVEIGSLIQNKYLLKTRLGHGAYGIVYAAENVVLGGQVALKFLGKQSSDAALRFTQEARIANGLGHPNICRVFDSGTTAGGTPFFVMEFLNGVTLRRRMSRGPMDASEAIVIMSQILSALGAAHAKRIIHRDIKPENIFLEAREGLDPLAKVLDFGLAKLSAGESKINTVKGVALGTCRYMAPEQLLGEPLDARTDLFASAVVLYETIAGRPPFIGETHADVTTQILRSTPHPLSAFQPGIPRALDAVMGRALQKVPAARFGSARELQSALHQAIGVVERQKEASHDSERLPNLGSDDADAEAKTIPNELYRKR